MPPDNAPILEPDETQLATFRPDPGRYWRDHGVMALGLMALAGLVIWLIGSPYPAIGSLGAILAVGLRAAYLASETLGLRWVLTNRRLILPDGQSAVMLRDVERVRPFLGDVQVITSAGDKHLLKHMADAEGVVGKITAARGQRAERRAS